jgi:hypothetical protein
MPDEEKTSPPVEDNEENKLAEDPLEARFQKFQGEVNRAFGLIVEQLGKLNENRTPAPAPKVEDDAGPDQDTPVPPAWRKAVIEILGIDFECELKQPDRGGTIFTIIVPKNKSNASQLHWQNFKQDRRSRELGNTGLDGVKTWCLKVRANLLATGAKLVQYP